MSDQLTRAIEARERAMYGQTIEDTERWYNHRLGSPVIYIMGILSDAQECIEQGDRETARQFINKAKYLMDKHLQPKPGERDLP